MITYLSKLPFADRLIVPDNPQSLHSTNELVEKMGLVYQVSSGFWLLSPISQIIMTNIENICYEEAYKSYYVPLSLPFIFPYELLKKSGKDITYGHEFYETEQKSKKYVFSPTTEEVILSYLKAGGLKSYKQLPMRFIHPHYVFRHIERPLGIFKSREFKSFLLSSVERDETGYKESLTNFIKISSTVFDRLGIETVHFEDTNNEVTEFLFNCDIGDRPLEKGVIANRSGQTQFSSQTLPSHWNPANIAMGYRFKEADKFGVQYADPQNKLGNIVLGTFGIGLQRCLYSLFQKARFGESKAFNSETRPFDIAILTAGKLSCVDFEFIKHLATNLCKSGMRVLIDDRTIPLSKKSSLSSFFCIPVHLPLGSREIAKGSATTLDIDGKDLVQIEFSEIQKLLNYVL